MGIVRYVSAQKKKIVLNFLLMTRVLRNSISWSSRVSSGSVRSAVSSSSLGGLLMAEDAPVHY